MERGRNLRHRAVLGKAQVPDQGDDVEAELAMRQGKRAFGLWAIGVLVEGAGAIMAAADNQGQGGETLEGLDLAVGMVADPEGVPTLPAGGLGGRQSLG